MMDNIAEHMLEATVKTLEDTIVDMMENTVKNMVRT